jgi:cytidyltransferase-like protein
MKAVLITGGFDPLHSGHISYMKEAKKLGDVLIVGVNSDEWLTRKKNQPFMTWNERSSIISELSCVDEVIAFDDSDGTAIDAIKQITERYDNVIFANGGDRSVSNIPEIENTSDNVSFVFGVGGETKQNSSSKILSEWKNPKTHRKWGYYRVLHSDGPETKVKELVVNPNKHLSLQRHQFRNEYWIVSNGTATVKVGSNDLQTVVLKKHSEIHIPLGHWHQLINNTDDELRIVEIQYGKMCIEEDIERLYPSASAFH